MPATDTTTSLRPLGQAAKHASRVLGPMRTPQKNDALLAIADELDDRADDVLAANAQDVEDGRANDLSDALLDRLLLTEQRVARLAQDVRRVAELPDPVGQDLDRRDLDNGMTLIRRRIPIGVLGVIYEARPNVTIDIAALSLKTGNAVILRGGSETLRSNLALVDVIQSALERTDVPRDAVQYIDNPDRALVTELLRMDEYVDMIIPRGGAGLHRLCREQSTIPVITGGIGICHIYVDEDAKLGQAVDIIENAKVQRPSVCNALDTLLVHRAVAPTLLPRVARRLAEHDVELRADEDAFALLKDGPAHVVPAGPDDFDQEWLALVLGIKVVDGLDAAIQHIQTHSTEHSDAILTTNQTHAAQFVDAINSAAVYVNASTRFTDGGEFGLGAEVAVSTQKLHARGPMGLEELTTYKWIGLGDGHVRS
ncbi:MAG: glutamate-5-semialdehyde dehydrogenase [Bacteroidetes bacterium]|jgi:glutamate-5-semialdehyde dehydrogenase|nr:glutamate-5-semialdehyde dehydrogenase [Bacteroidota bacterium]